MAMSKLTSLEEGIAIALDALRANKVRSSLTILGVAIGVGVVVAMAAAITGLRSSIVEGFESAGPDNFIVTRFDFSNVRIVSDGSRPPWAGKPRIEPEEAKLLARLPGVEESLYNFGMAVSMSYEGRRESGIQANGYSAGWVKYTAGDFTAGRDFTDEEVRQSRPLVVLSKPLADELFGDRDPIGRRIRVSAGRRGVSEAFTVVGVFEPEPNIFTAAIKNWAVFPYTSAMKRLKASNWQAQILIVPRDDVPQAEVIDQVVGAMRVARGLRPAEENNFAVLRSAQLLEQFDRLTGVFFLVMLALSSVGLMVGGIGVIGIMMISVTERTREIGVRKALGATRREILWQFLVEAAVLTLLGGALGMLIGWGVASFVRNFTPIPAAIPLWSVVAALAMAILTGMLFGLLPAHRASRLEPVAALRYE